MASNKQKKNSNSNSNSNTTASSSSSINTYLHQRGKRILRRYSPSTVINDLVGGSSSPETTSSSSSSSTTGTTTSTTMLKKTKKKKEEEEKLSSSWSSSHSSSSTIGTTITSTSTSTTNTTSVTAVRTVSFNSKCYIKRTISIYDYTTEEIENCWYSKNELDTITLICTEDIHKINRNNKRNKNKNNSNSNMIKNHQQDDHHNDDDDLCVRGLDRCIVPSVFIKRDNREKAKNAVFMEQYYNSLWGSSGDDSYTTSTSTSTGTSSTSTSTSSTLSLCSPEEIIANKYNEISYRCQLLAIDIALQDQRNAVYDMI